MRIIAGAVGRSRKYEPNLFKESLNIAGISLFQVPLLYSLKPQIKQGKNQECQKG